ncbi:MAG: hypothetical protein ACOX2K_04855 [Bacillota bacterium]|jgi:hypothetical protein
MRKFSLRLVAALVFGSLLIGIWWGTSVAATSVPSPGSNQDPLVSKSYVDQAVATLEQAMAALLDQGVEQQSEGVSLQVVVVPAGQKLIASQGTEFILRSGSGKIIASAAGGVPDLSAAVDLQQGVEIPKNHLLLFPKNDGRGFLATTELIVMVRGQWELQP